MDIQYPQRTILFICQRKSRIIHEMVADLQTYATYSKCSKTKLLQRVKAKRSIFLTKFQQQPKLFL